MYRSLGMDTAACAQFLHVTERTLHNWESGKHDIPFAAYKLLRLLNRMELPGKAWEGWCFHHGTLYSPEGHPFVGSDSSWWSLLIRRANMFGEMSRKLKEATAAVEAGRAAMAQAQRAGAARPAAAGPDVPTSGRREAPGLNLSLRHFGTSNLSFAANAGAYAIKPVALKVAA
jgi:hypothetical protein